jgi:hypothetical protein
MQFWGECEEFSGTKTQVAFYASWMKAKKQTDIV